MSLEDLSQRTKEVGAAAALVVLDSKSSLFSLATPALIRGRLQRELPQINEQLISELGNSFTKGWDELRNTLEEAKADPFQFGTRIKQLIEDAIQPNSQARYYPNLGLIYGAITEIGLQDIVNKSGIKEIFHGESELKADKPVAGGTDVNAPTIADIWGIKRMGASDLWAQGYTGKDVLVAHLDSGADSEHEALRDAIEENVVVNDSGTGSQTVTPYKDSGTHGTHTAATIVGRSGAGDMKVGMAPGATLACGTVIDAGDKIARLLDGLDWAVGLGARIINLSVGFEGFNPIFETLMNRLRENQVLPVVSIGNAGPGKSRSPGNYKSALSVGGTDQHDMVPLWSGSAAPGTGATGPTLCAPGARIVSAFPGGKYRKESGSSMAAPHISGLAALLLDACPTATIDQLQAAIVGSCNNPNNISPDRIGAGIPDAIKALEILTGARV